MQTERPIHFVEDAIPAVQSGFTLRTHRLVLAQRELGMDSCVVAKPTSRFERNDSVCRNGVGVSTQDGVPYYRFTARHAITRMYIRCSDYLRKRNVPGSWRFGGKFPLSANAWEEFVKHIPDQVGGTIVHAHSPFGNYWPAQTVAKSLDVPWIYEVRGFWELSNQSTGSDSMRKNLTNDEWAQHDTEAAVNANAVITLGSAMLHELVRRGVPKKNIHVVGNGVDADVFQPLRKIDQELTSKLCLDDCFVLGYVTSVRRLEGIETVLRAVNAISDSDHKVVFILVGDGPDLPRLKQLSAQLGVEEYVRFVGRVPHADVKRYYSLFDAFVVPRTNDEVCRIVTPLKPLESMAMEIPTIISDVPALRELVQPGVTGDSFLPEDEVDLARVIVRMIENPEWRKQISVSARKWIKEHRSWKILAAKTRDIYATVRSDYVR